MPGGFGVLLREPQGERALMPTDRKPGFVSGVDILSNGGLLPPPIMFLSQLLFRRFDGRI